MEVLRPSSPHFHDFKQTKKTMKESAELAKGYTKQNQTQFELGLSLLEKLGVAPGMQVLDVGCGPGNITAHLAKVVGESGSVVGIDPSTERIALARQIAIPNLTFYEGKAEDLSRFPSDSFDIVYVNSTFHWVLDQPKAMREFFRVLKSGGRLGMSGGSGDYTAAHERIKADVLAREPYCHYPEKDGPTFLKQRDLESLLESAGFHEHKIVINTIVRHVKDSEEMMNWLVTSSSGKTYGGIPLDFRPKAREEMKLEWDKLTTEDGIDMEMELLVTVATKP